MQFSTSSPSRFEVVLWFFRVVLLLQVVNAVGNAFQNTAYIYALSGTYSSSPLWQWGVLLMPLMFIVFLSLAAKPLCYAATANDDSPPRWTNVALPALGLILITLNLPNLWPAIVEVVPYVMGQFSGGNISSSAVRGASSSYNLIAFGVATSRLLLGCALAFIPPLRARWRATANR